MIHPRPTPIPSKRPSSNVAAGILWGVLLAVLLVRAGVHAGRPSSLTTYLAGGSAWANSAALYTNWRGFVYSPVIAWFFSLLVHLPPVVAAIAWRILTAGTFLWGLGALVRSGVFHRIPAESRWLVFLGVLPLSIGNIDNAQANPLVAGLMMLSVAAVQWEAWTLCAIAVGIATAFKIYPAALALLLCLVRPRQIAWRYALVLLLLAALPFAFHDSHYVTGQYQAWLRTRLADDRFHYPMKDAPLDLWYLLVRLGHLPIPPRAYTAFQVLAGGALAMLVWNRCRRGVPLPDVLAALYLLVTLWMLVLGPATETQTYVVLAPAACLLLVETFSTRDGPGTRWLAAAGFCLMLAAVGRDSLAPHLKSPLSLAMQPVAALLLFPAVLLSTRPATPPSPR